MNIIYRQLTLAEIRPALFAPFDRYQEVRQVWQQAEESWQLVEAAHYVDWNEADKALLCDYLRATAESGGLVLAAFRDEELCAFASLENQPLGQNGQMLELSSLHVSRPLRGRGMGRALFRFICAQARRRGAQKLYISTHPAAETQTFYEKLGCQAAQEPQAQISAQHPGDRQLEYLL